MTSANVRSLGLLALLACLVWPAVAFAQSHAYSYSDISDLIEGGVPAHAILSKTKTSCIDFKISASVAKRLKAKGASDALIEGLKSSCYRGVQSDDKVQPEPKPIIPVLITPRRDTVVIEFPSVSVSRSEGVQLGGSSWGRDIVLNSPPYAPKFNLVEYTFSAPLAGKYRLQALMAAAASRPLQVTVNGATVFGSAFGDVTGGWRESDAQWVTAGDVILVAGTNTLTLTQQQFLPHLVRFRLIGQP